MDLIEMTVTDQAPSTGTVMPPYDFYAYSGDSNNESNRHIVKIVMPLGGLESGLFRFPKVGEKVLVGVQTDTNSNTSSRTYYLMGYVPSNAASGQPFTGQPGSDTTEADVINKQGQVFRYKKTGDVMPGEYSEIGFYNEPTQWRAVHLFDSMDIGDNVERGSLEGYMIRYTGYFDNKRHYEATKKVGDDTSTIEFDSDWTGRYKAIDNWFCEHYGADKGTASNGTECYTSALKNYSPVDRINIQSTGDIRSTAGNHQLIMGKRLEILSGAKEIDHRTNTVKGSTDGELPLGDKKGDDSGLHGGDVHIRAGGRVVIKAAKEIRLQVGRTVLVISDKGFSVVTKKVNSNWPNTCDTTLSMNPRTGISMSGQNVTISGAYKASMMDSLGANISTQIGTVQIRGRDITLSNYDVPEFLINSIGAGVEIGFNAGLLGAGMFNEYNAKNASSVKLTLDSLIKLKNIIKKIVGQVKDIKKVMKENNEINEVREAWRAGREQADHLTSTQEDINGVSYDVIARENTPEDDPQ